MSCGNIGQVDGCLGAGRRLVLTSLKRLDDGLPRDPLSELGDRLLVC